MNNETESSNESQEIKKYEKEVGLYSRLISRRNTTHDNLVDMSIQSITLWKIDKKKRTTEIVLYIISIGILFILEFFFPKIIIKLRCIPTFIDDAEYVLITNKHGKSKFIKLICNPKGGQELELQNITIPKEESENNIIKRNKSNKSYNSNIFLKENIDYTRKRKSINFSEKTLLNINKNLIQKEKLNCVKYFEYLNNKYKYEENEGQFVPVTFYINRYTINEISTMKNGISSMEICQDLYLKYGLNKIKIKHHDIFQSILYEACEFSYLYVLICMIIWLYEEYYWSTLVVFIITILLILINSKNKIENLQSLGGEENKKTLVIRENSEKEIKTEDIVPGDLILLKYNKEGKIHIPCDGIILEGFCTVNESDLTGENTLVLKREISFDENPYEYFDYIKYKNCFLFQGTQIDSLYSSQSKIEIIKMLATDTGFNTYRGNMIKNWEEQNINFSRKIFDYAYVLILIIIILLINLMIHLILYDKELPRESDPYYSVIREKIYKNNFSYSDLKILSLGDKFFSLLNDIVTIFPPTIILCIKYGRIFYNRRLKERNISCVNDKKIDTSGNIDIIVLDKTGTLTESQLEINCYKVSSPDNQRNLNIGDEELTSRMMNKIYKKFWQNIYKKKLNCAINNTKNDISYQTSYLYNIIYFAECLATCHNIFCFNQKIFGNTLDKILFSEMNWEIYQENDDLKNPLIIQPHNSYKITENSLIGSLNSEINIENNIEIANLTKENTKSRNVKHKKGKCLSTEEYDDKKHKSKNKNSRDKSDKKYNQTISEIGNKRTSSNINLLKLKKKVSKLESNFYLKYLQRNEFQSQFQSMSVVVKNSIDNTIRLYIKGAPEKIKKCCNSLSIPKDLNLQLQKYTGKGYRVLACATKLLQHYEPNSQTREEIEKNMIFLGIIVFKNQIKHDTKININHLEASGCKLLIATGDNVFTTVSVAEQCGLLDVSDDLYRIETIDSRDETGLIIIHSSFLETNSKNENNEENININLNNSNINVNMNKYFNNNINYVQSEESEDENMEMKYSIRENENPAKFLETICDIVKNQKIRVCFSGAALSILLERINNKNEHENNILYYEYLEKLIEQNGKIFFRMLPDNKSNLIAFLQKDKYTVVAMCGDGANDSNAFMQSDVGVAINQTIGNNLISHFYSTENSISCLKIIIKNGRACFESRLGILKYIMSTSMLQLSVVFTLYIYYQQFNTLQCMFINLISILFPCLLMTSTKTNYNLSRQKPPRSIVNVNFVLGVFGLFVIEYIGILIFIIILKSLCLDEVYDLLPINDLNVKSSYVFLFMSIQNCFLLMIVSSRSVDRLPLYTNKLYMLYFAVILVFLIRLITLNKPPTLKVNLIRFEPESYEFEKNKEIVKMIIILMNIVIQIIAFVYNMIINRFFDWRKEGILRRKK